jgi:GAF domain-containing protein
VIAIENVRLFQELQTRNRELTEALEQQTATSEILRVISRSPTDLQPVLDAVVASAARLCGADDVILARLDGDTLHSVAGVGPVPRLAPQEGYALSRGSVAGRAVLDRRTVHVHDLAAEPDAEFPVAKARQRLIGTRTILATPLLREGSAIGALVLRRMEVRPFTEKEIKLLETFANQAVIAIENVRLFTELEEKNRALAEAHAQVTEALEQQTATAEILRVIASSPTDLQPVMEAIAENAARVCAAMDSGVFLLEGELGSAVLRRVSRRGSLIRAVPMGESVPVSHDMVGGRVVFDRRTIHVEDIRAAEAEFPVTVSRLRQVGSDIRTMVATPLLREGTPLGVIFANRGPEPNPFSAKQIALLETFANQAVIAIENVRLFKELEARNSDLTEALDKQTATSEILRVISGSQTDVQPVFDTIIQSAVRLLGGFSGVITQIVGHQLHLAALTSTNPEGAVAKIRERGCFRPRPGHHRARAALHH